MFICSECLKDDPFYMPQSRGPCEVCGKVKVCYDIHHSQLPESKPEPDRPSEAEMIKESEVLERIGETIGVMDQEQLARLHNDITSGYKKLEPDDIEAPIVRYTFKMAKTESKFLKYYNLIWVARHI